MSFDSWFTLVVYIFQLFFILPKLWFSVWALVARLVIPRCSSLVHQLPITCSPRDRLKGMAGTSMHVTFPHAVLLRHERVACHCFMSFGLCDKNGTASCGYKSQPLSARQTKKSPWQYSLEVFQGIPPRIFLPCHSRRKLV